ncbi:MAG: carbon starvation protein A [Planctomycetes bacterium]|nr:carbon starvation protein A [Planctomycetota bacterium]
MNILFILLPCFVLLALGYFLYGRLVARIVKLNDNTPTPAVCMTDGVDYVPAKPFLLLGQHFSAIAAAGPIAGPILAGIYFGWLPTIVWIIIGAIFIGGVHDFTTLVASVRHKALSIGEIVKQYISKPAFYLFLCFVWLTLVYVIIAFTDMTAQTFKTVVANESYGPAVAGSSFMYLGLGLLMGLCLYKFRMPLWLATLIFVPAVVVVIWAGPQLPQGLLDFFGAITAKEWNIVLLLYCFIASVIPVWLLLQSRGYLGGFLLYGTIAAGLVGVFFGGFSVGYPAINLAGLKSLFNDKPMLPLLVITVACGACSGFHAIVGSGTTSKQLCKESDAKLIGYGGMLMEAVVALLALSTIMFLKPGDAALKGDPGQVYASGLAKYAGLLGIDFNLALAFGLLAFSTFIYDTLDVCTRLGRYVFQEIFGWQSRNAQYLATFVTLLVPFVFLMGAKEQAYKIAWPLFGTSNQLLASLTLLGVSVWLWRTGKNAIITIIPMAFMLVMTLWSLVMMMVPGVKNIINGKSLDFQGVIMTMTSIILFILALCVIGVTVNVIARIKSKPIQ